jgi:hypothetical protein
MDGSIGMVRRGIAAHHSQVEDWGRVGGLYSGARRAFDGTPLRNRQRCA